MIQIDLRQQKRPHEKSCDNAVDRPPRQVRLAFGHFLRYLQGSEDAPKFLTAAWSCVLA
jgi:hypothetical protein